MPKKGGGIIAIARGRHLCTQIMVSKHHLSLKRIPEAKAESRFGTGNVQNKPRITCHTIKCENYQRLLGSC